MGESSGLPVHSVLGVPVCNNEGDVIGVAQLINRKSGEDHHFTEHDIEASKLFQSDLIYSDDNNVEKV